MSRGRTTTDRPDVSGVLDCLADDGCRAILGATATPRTVPELSETCDIPVSTVYRKVDRLVERSLLRSQPRIDPTGRHPTQYRRTVDCLVVRFVDGDPVVESDPGDRTDDGEDAAPASERPLTDGAGNVVDLTLFGPDTGEAAPDE